MAQVIQWVPAIHNYTRKVRLKYQHVPPLFILQSYPIYSMLTIIIKFIISLQVKLEDMKKCGKPAAYIHKQICSDLMYYVYVVKLLSNVWENGTYMLTFQPHLPRPVARGGDEPASEIKGPLFKKKGPLF